MRLPLAPSTFALALALLAPPASAEWKVNSEFRLHLTESTFDQIIQDFWQSLQGTQRVAVGNVGVNLGDTQLGINGINVAVNYSFPIPKRTDENHREWKLQSDKLGARVTVDQLVITQHKVINVGGIEVGTNITVTCNNIGLSLPEGLASISAVVRAEVAQNQVQLSMPSYNATWPNNAWQVSSINCPELANVGGIVKDQILQYLSHFENLDSSVNSALVSQFNKWSQQASLLLLSQQELPTGVDHLKAYYQPQTARENDGNGLILGGVLQLVYPYVAKGQHFEQSFSLPEGTEIVPQASPQLLIPFAAIRAMMMGEYFTGRLEYSMRSAEIPAFQDLMGSFWKKLFGFPDLLHFASDTTFLFQFLPLGPPSFDNEKAGAANEILGDLNLPLSMRMYAPEGGQYTPYVEFRTLLSGSTSMSLGQEGKINFKINAAEQPVTYAFAQTYFQYRTPNTKIAVDTIAKAARSTLSTDGLQIAIPVFKVGNSLTLSPADWALQKGSALRLNFKASSKAMAPSTVKTTNGKKLTVSSTKKK